MIHNPIALITGASRDWITSDQTPNPRMAKVTPTIVATTLAITLGTAMLLNRIARWSTAVGTLLRPIARKVSDRTWRTGRSWSSPKNDAIGHARPIRANIMMNPSPTLNQYTVSRSVLSMCGRCTSACPSPTARVCSRITKTFARAAMP